MDSRTRNEAADYSYRLLTSNDVRLIELLPSTYDDEILIRITHRPLEQDAYANVKNVVPRVKIQAALPDGWTAFKTPEQRWFFWDGKDPEPTSYEHPDAELNAALQSSDVERSESQLDYEALSYVWGSQTSKPEIFVSPDTEDARCANACVARLRIGENLRDALRQLRYPDHPRRLWIDAICINQEDLEERSRQVKRMGQIYGLAARVVVWLGLAADNSALAMKLLQYLGEQIEIGDNCWQFRAPEAKEQAWWNAEQRLPYSEREWQAVTSLFRRPWFERLWVLQEVKLANTRILVLCGRDSMSYACFRRAMLALYERRGAPVLLLSTIRARQESSYTDDRANVATLIKVTRTLKCSDPRDKVYGILSIVGRRFKDAICPSYAKPTVEVYKQAFLSYVETTGRLDLMLQCAPAQNGRDNPSWVPDWRTEPDTWVGLNEGFQAAGSSRSIAHYHGPRTLQVEGVDCGQLRMVYDPLPRDPRQIVQGLRDIAPGDLLDGVYPTGESKLQAWSRTLCLDNFYDRFPVDEIQVVKLASWVGIITRLFHEPDRLSEALGQLYSRITSGCANMSFCDTNGELMGFAPSSARPGDRICVLLGCWAPIILRPLWEGCYGVIGSCYIHGLMDGEAVLGPLPPHWTVQQHVINGQYMPRYLNKETGHSQNDPRLPTLQKWSRIDFERDEDDPINVEYFRHDDTGEIVNADPRLSVLELQKRGVKLETFVLQ